VCSSDLSHKEALIELVSNRSLKFTAEQARAILEMRLRQLTNLDVTDLETEKTGLEKTGVELKELVEMPETRQKWVFKQMDELAKRHGNARQSQLIAKPDVYVVQTTKKASLVGPQTKPRFMLVDQKKGIVTQAKGPRGAMVVDRSEKVVLMTQDGTLKKVASNFKGPISDGYSPVVLA
jgi:DNA gyrase/topoisomerase IV subunit A